MKLSDAGAASNRPLGILGGTFDPIHIAHLRMAQEAMEAGGLEAVRFIPAGQPTHRDRPGAFAADRLAMARLALHACPGFELDESEALSAAPSYTVHTLERLRQQLGQRRPLVLLLGVDAFLGLPKWHRWRDLLDLAHIAVATRPGHVMDFTNPATTPQQLQDVLETRFIPFMEALATSPAGRISQFAMTPLDVSATAIRAQLAAGKSPRFLVPDSVLDYIEANRLYA